MTGPGKLANKMCAASIARMNSPNKASDGNKQANKASDGNKQAKPHQAISFLFELL